MLYSSFLFLLQQHQHDTRSRMEYKSIREMADEWGISKRRIQVLCVQNRIEGAVRIGYSWAIPANAKKPEDARIKNGKYIKRKDDK